MTTTTTVVDALTTGLLLIGMVLLLALFTGWITMFTWAIVVPQIFGLPALTYWQAVAMNILAGLLLRPTVHTHPS